MSRQPFFPCAAVVLSLTLTGCDSGPTDLVESPLASANVRQATQEIATVLFSTPSVDRGLAQGIKRKGKRNDATFALVITFEPVECQHLVFIPDSDFTWSMDSATLKASTNCGDVDLSWSRTGPVTTNPVNLMTACPPDETVRHHVITGPNAVASVTGTHNGEAVTALEPPTIVRQTDVVRTCNGS